MIRTYNTDGYAHPNGPSQYLVVTLPESAYDIHLFDSVVRNQHINFMSSRTNTGSGISLPPGPWMLLGSVGEIRKDEKKTNLLIPIHGYPANSYTPLYKGYRSLFDNSGDAFSSLAAAQNWHDTDLVLVRTTQAGGHPTGTTNSTQR